MGGWVAEMVWRTRRCSEPDKNENAELLAVSCEEESGALLAELEQGGQRSNSCMCQISSLLSNISKRDEDEIDKGDKR